MQLSLASTFLILTSVTGSVAQVHIDTGARQMLTSADKGFAMEAAQNGLAEVRFGRLAAQKGGTPELKQLGAQIAESHDRLNEKLTAIVARDQMVLPNVLNAKDQAHYDKLERLSGADFDKAYLGEMVKAHEAAVKEFERQAKNGKDERLRSFASESLPVLEQHLQKLKSLHSQI